MQCLIGRPLPFNNYNVADFLNYHHGGCNDDNSGDHNVGLNDHSSVFNEHSAQHIDQLYWNLNHHNGFGQIMPGQEGAWRKQPAT